MQVTVSAVSIVLVTECNNQLMMDSLAISMELS